MITVDVVAGKHYICSKRTSNLVAAVAQKYAKIIQFKMEESRLQKLLGFLASEPNDEFIQYALATEYLRLNDTKTALQYYEGLVANHPNYTGTYYHLGKLYETLNRKEEALQTYQQGMVITRQKRDNHAFSELQSAYNQAAGLYDDDDDDY